MPKFNEWRKGRRAEVAGKNDNASEYWIGLDLGGTKMLALVFDSRFRVVGRLRKKTKAYEGADAGLGRIERVLRGAAENAKIDFSRVAGIGLGIPGNLDLHKGILLKSPNLGWQNVKIRDDLCSKLGCNVALLNDVDAGVFGEYVRGAAKGCRCVVGAFPGTGIGGGCVFEGTLITAGARSCMEIGHIPVVPDGMLCGCGNRGCLETVASRLAISGLAAAAAYRGEAPHLMATAGCDISKMRTGVLVDAVKAGDEAVAEIIKKAAGWLGRGIASLINLFAPDVVLLGGGLVEGFPDLYREEVSAVVKEYSMPAYHGTHRIVVAKLGDDAVASGAAAWAQRRVQATE